MSRAVLFQGLYSFFLQQGLYSFVQVNKVVSCLSLTIEKMKDRQRYLSDIRKDVNMVDGGNCVEVRLMLDPQEGVRVVLCRLQVGKSEGHLKGGMCCSFVRASRRKWRSGWEGVLDKRVPARRVPSSRWHNRNCEQLLGGRYLTRLEMVRTGTLLFVRDKCMVGNWSSE